MLCDVVSCLVLPHHVSEHIHVKRLVFPNTIKLYTTCNEFHIFWGFSPPRSFKLDCFVLGNLQLFIALCGWEGVSAWIVQLGCVGMDCVPTVVAYACASTLCQGVCAHVPWLRQLQLSPALGSINAVLKTRFSSSVGYFIIIFFNTMVGSMLHIFSSSVLYFV